MQISAFLAPLLKRELPTHKYPELATLQELDLPDKALQECKRGYRHIRWSFSKRTVDFPDKTPSWQKQEPKPQISYRKAITERLTQSYTRLAETHGIQAEHIRTFNDSFFTHTAEDILVYSSLDVLTNTIIQQLDAQANKSEFKRRC